jgi:hypothetical protein
MVRQKKRKISRWLPFLIHWLFWGGYFTLLWSKQLVVTSNGWRAGWIGTWADGAAHLTYMSAFAFRDKFPMMLPVYWGQKFTYPFMADMIGGLLVRLGLSLPLAYSIWGLVLSLTLVGIIFLFFKLIFKNGWVSLVGSALFFWSGGLGWWWFIKDAIKDGLVTNLMALPREYTHLGEYKVEWINVISGELVPQRAFLLGLPVGLGILIILWKLTNEKINKSWLVVAGVLTGLLAIIHPHTMLVIGVVSGWWMAMDIVVKRKLRIDWLYYFIPALLVSIPLLNLFVFSAIEKGFFTWLPGWLANSKNDNFFWFWIKNWGMWPILVMGGFLVSSKKIKLWLMPFAMLLVAANLILFQPYDWDNAKVLTWIYLVFSGVAGWFLVWLWQKKHWLMRAVAVGLFLIASFSGMLDSLRLLQFKNISLPMFNQEELGLAQKVRQETDTEAVFLTSDKHNHWVPALTGRQILMGYRGWMWTYGINYSQREKEIKIMFQGKPEAEELLQKYGISYVVIGPAELYGDFMADQKYFAAKYPMAFESENYVVYKVN